ncbi:hypothetical protein ACHAXR_000646 [Thalassiosira sp. AJA248-18]
MAATTSLARCIILFGDSDISRWPPHLYPSGSASGSSVSNYGKSGAVLSDLSPQIEEWKNNTMMEGERNYANTSNNRTPKHLYICCAGENDVGSGHSLDQILDTFRAMLDKLFSDDEQMPLVNDDNGSKILIFLGPKFEPWLAQDFSSRKQYTKLNNAFQRAIRKHRASNQIFYIDCLTLFCTTDTANVPGAVYGGKATPDSKYFNADGLHLNEMGYGVWKKIVEEKITELNYL